ncbi:MAG: hypothetical protein LBS50_09320 [Prevotellaceae bacterium]|jgi:IS30 family transposase|nr:hypothetical protein [Prevotellaceae bacterium]
MWHKGSVENINKLVRHYLIKKTNFDVIDNQTVTSRPRKLLNFNCPN